MPDLTRIPAFAVLKNGDFRTLWTVKVVNEVSRRIELLALGYLVLWMKSLPTRTLRLLAFLMLSLGTPSLQEALLLIL